MVNIRTGMKMNEKADNIQRKTVKTFIKPGKRFIFKHHFKKLEERLVP